MNNFTNTRLGIFVLLALANVSFGAETQPPNNSLASTGPSATLRPASYAPASRDASQKVWNKITEEIDEDGQTVLTTNQAFVEIATGMHYRKNSKWLETREEFQLVPGWAMAANGPHRVGVAYNLNLRGSVAVTMPDGGILRSHLSALYYLDSASNKSVLLANVKDCEGKLLPPNQILFENALDNVKADVRYTYTKAGLEQDVILRQQPPSPAQLGLDPASTWLVALTEFVDPPPAKVLRRANAPDPATLTPEQSMRLNDEDISFGLMQIIRGQAFSLSGSFGPSPIASGTATKLEVPVVKKWLEIEGRHFLFEKVLLSAAQSELQKLPEQAGLRPRSTRSLNAGIELPRPRRQERASVGIMQTARHESITREPGYVMDYTLVNVDTNNLTFIGDTTYYVSGRIVVSGQITFEGGTVIKYSPTNSAQIYAPNGDFNCQTMPYCPAILTARDDDTVGEVITGSSGLPTNYLNALDVDVTGAAVLNHLAVRFATYGISVYTEDAAVINDVQFVKCDVPLDFHNTVGSVRNCLFDRCGIPFAGANYEYDVENATINNCWVQFSHSWTGTGTIDLTNCIAVGLTNWGNAGTILTNNSVASLTPMPWLFQSVGAGNYYLATNSPYRDIGSTNINATLLSELGNKTTYPPIVYSNASFASALTLSPQAGRDHDVPDLGYHYTPLDYITHYLIVTNDVFLTNGVAVGYYNDLGLIPYNAANVASIGTVNAPNWLARYSCVQEQPVKVGTGTATAVNQFHFTGTGPVGVFRFTKFSSLARVGTELDLLHAGGNGSYTNLLVQNCEFYNSSNIFSGTVETIAVVQNNLFHRSGISAAVTSSVTNWLAFSNNTVIGAAIQLNPRSSSNQWSVFNNAFASTSVGTTNLVANGYNAYYKCTGNGRYFPTNLHDLVSTSALTWQTGPLGDYYQPTNSPLLNAGSTTADLTGLYHFTTTTNQVKETNTVVDIGYHYVAVDANGNPIDSDLDGVPDYLEDANGNGNGADDAEDWLINRYNGLSATSKLQVFTPLKP